MSNHRYEFKVNPDRTECQIFLKRPAGKFIGRVIKANGQGHVEYAPGVMWLPKLEALAALGLDTKQAEAQVLRELGY